LGPDEENKFHELRCIGIEDVTSEFRKYDLIDIIEGYKGTLNKDGTTVHCLNMEAGGKSTF